jgi:uncharacterized protein (DUF849 family)
MSTNQVASGATDVKKEVAKTIITAALTGATGSKKLNPAIPITPEEIAEDAYACYQAGAAMVHLHMKKDDGESPSMSVEKFKKTRALIEEKCDIIVNMTTSGEVQQIDDCAVIGSFKKEDTLRTALLELRPEVASFDIPTMNFGRSIILFPIPFLEYMGKKMIEFGVRPEIEVFDIGDIRSAISLMKQGYLESPGHFQFCLGVAGGAGATVENLAYMSRLIPEGSTWSAFGLGPAHLPTIFTTLALGGHVRVGLEDNLYYSKGELATNPRLVKRAADIIKIFGNDVATPNEAREILRTKNQSASLS